MRAAPVRAKHSARDTAWAMSKENMEVVRGIFEAAAGRNDVTRIQVDAEDIEAAGLWE
jgi:hypothetical protein